MSLLEDTFDLGNGVTKTRKEISEMEKLPDGFFKVPNPECLVVTADELIKVLSSPEATLVARQMREERENEFFGKLFDEFTSQGIVDATKTILDLAVNPWKDLSKEEKETAKTALNKLRHVLKENEDDDCGSDDEVFDEEG